MAFRRRLELTLPNEAAALPCALAVVREAAAQRGLPLREAQRLEVATEEAVVNVLQHAYRPHEEATFTVACLPTALGLAVEVWDAGLPFDPETIDPSTDAALGTRILRRVVDRCTYQNLGRGGKRVRLEVVLPDARHDTEDPAPEPAPIDPPAPREEPSEYTLREFQRGDGLEVARCLYATYGYTYLREDFYHPERLERLHAEGQLHAAVAIAPNGRLVGHLALVETGVFPGLAELSAAAVAPEHRGRGLLEGLNERCLARAKALGLAGLYVEAVAAHPYSQKAAHHQGFRDCGFLLAGLPPSDYKGLAEPGNERVSLVFGYLPLSEPTPGLRYVPEFLVGFASSIYGHLGLTPTLVAPPREAPPHRETLMTVVVVPELQSMDLHIAQVGQDFDIRLKQEHYRMDRLELRVGHAFLDLADPWAAVCAARLAAHGFLATAIVPCAEGRDRMVLQHFNGMVPDYGALQLADPFSRELLGRIRETHLAL